MTASTLLVIPARHSRPQVNAGISGQEVTALLDGTPAFAGVTVSS